MKSYCMTQFPRVIISPETDKNLISPKQKSFSLLLITDLPETITAVVPHYKFLMKRWDLYQFKKINKDHVYSLPRILTAGKSMDHYTNSTGNFKFWYERWAVNKGEANEFFSSLPNNFIVLGDDIYKYLEVVDLEDIFTVYNDPILVEKNKNLSISYDNLKK